MCAESSNEVKFQISHNLSYKILIMQPWRHLGLDNNVIKQYIKLVLLALLLHYSSTIRNMRCGVMMAKVLQDSFPIPGT